MTEKEIITKIKWAKGLLPRAFDKESVFFGEQERIKRVIKQYENMLKEPE